MRWWSSLFPMHPNCWFCDQPLAKVPFARAWSHICMDCKLYLSPLHSPGCEVCSRPLLAGESLCDDCALVPPVARVSNVSVMSYTNKTKRIIARFKYAGDERLAVPIAALMQETVVERYKNIPFHIVTSVPLHRLRLVERGFNQAQLLAEHIAKSIGVPAKMLLTRQKAATPQATLSKHARMQSLQDAFVLDETAKQLDLTAQTILLVDDVYTTGTTIRECAAVLRQAGAYAVYAVTFAR